jgi:hypothetical protein
MDVRIETYKHSWTKEITYTPLEEYGTQINEEENTATCFVKSTEGDNFSICVRISYQLRIYCIDSHVVPCSGPDKIIYSISLLGREKSV